MSTRGSPRPPSAAGGSRPGSGARSPVTTQRQRGEVSPRGSLHRGPAVMSESARRTSSPGMGMDDMAHLQEQLRQLRAEISQLQEENRNESDTVAQLRKRINVLEREKLETASRYNEETTSLQSQVARLRAQLEKGEAVRQNLEYELTLARKNISQEKRQAEDKEGQILRNNDDLRAQVSELSRQVDDLDSGLKIARIQATEQENQHRLLMEEKDKVIAHCHAEQDVVTAERDKLDSMLEEQHNINSDLQDRIKELEAERSSQADTIRRQITDLDYGSEREGRAKKEIEALQQRIKQLEENIEAERAAHLESKFNSEIVQLRVRDLEGALEVEKSAHSDASMNLEMITRQLREVEAAFEEERTACNKYKEQLDRSDKQYTSVQQQLSSELEEKKTAISGMSKQLGLHQANFDELKEELARARKRQVYLEETYGGCMRELELLMDNFRPDQSAPPKRKSSGKQKGKPTSPSVVLETLRHALINYQNKLDAAHDELDKLRKSYEKVSSESESYKDTVWSRSKALEETQAALTNTKKELSRVQSENSEHEASLALLHSDMEKAMHRLDQERKKCDELNDEIQKLTKIYKNENADKIHFLHTLYQRLVTGRVVMESTDPSLSSFSWPELASMVQEQVDSLLTDLHRTRERLGHMETVVKNKDESMVHLQQNHEKSMEKVAVATRDREDSWAKQKSDLEQHYASLLQELQSNSKKSQSLADQAWEQVRATGTLKEGLEAECADLRGKLSRAQSEHSSLLTACALLIGALYPMYARTGALAAQRALMEEQFNNCEAMKHQAKILVETLSSAMGEMTGTVSTTTRPWNPILKFRVGVVAVLAANRLSSFTGQGCKLFVSHDAPDGVGRSIVCIGGVKGSVRPITGVGLGDRRHGRDSHYSSLNGYGSQNSYRRNNHGYGNGTGMSDGRNQRSQNGRTGQTNGGTGRSIKQAAVRWFHSPDLLGVLVNSVAELQETLNRTDPQSGLPSSKAIVSSARNSFAKLMNKLSPEFSGLMADGNGGNYREKGALIRFLGHGLNRVLAHSALSGKLQVMSSQQIMSSLQHHILDFTQHLHAAEVERRGLRAEVAKLHNETDLLRRHRDKVTILEDEVEHLRTENSQLVPKDRFDSVCQELSSALQREQQAQQLLNEQSSQMHQLGNRLDEGAEREKTLSEAVKDLSEAKMDMRRKEQSLRQLNKRLSQLETERRELQEGLMNAENDLRTSAKEKETLASYLKSVDIALQESKDQVVLSRTGMGPVEFTLPQLMLPSEKIAAEGGAIGPELIACQNVVQTFVEAQQQALSRISVLEEEITSHKNHISTLKRELSEACRRELDQDEVVDRLAPETPYGTRSAPRYAADRSYREDFAPLRGEIDNSYSILKASPNRRGTSMATPHISDRLRSPTRVRTPSPTRTRPLPRDYSRNFSGSRR